MQEQTLLHIVACNCVYSVSFVLRHIVQANIQNAAVALRLHIYSNILT
jgi:hypothetical protein